MGVDLALLPFDFESDRFSFSHTVLNTERRKDLWEEIARLESKAVPDGFNSYVSRNDDYEESHYGETLETPYGDRLTYVLASDLLAFWDHPGVKDEEKNRAVWAYLNCLNPQTKVALFWH